MLEIMLGLSTAVVAVVALAKTSLLQISWFAGLEEQAQSLVLQAVAFVAALIAVAAQSVNLFPAAPEWLGLALTGLIVSTGSAGIHAILALLGIRAGVTASKEAAPIRAQGAGSVRSTYAPFM